MNNLRVAVVQTDIHWEDAEKNLAMFSEKIDNINEQVDIIVLPEMFNTGFSMDVEHLSEKMDGITIEWMKNKSKDLKVVLVGSLIVEDTLRDNAKKSYLNRLIWMQPDGEYFAYDKRHLFRMASEEKYFTGGGKRLIINYKGWKICPLICYDLRFPVWSRNTKLDVDVGFNAIKNSKIDQNDIAYDCLIYIANWPAVRSSHWSNLLEARAIENQTYVIGVNRVGVDGKGHNYSGDSVIIHPKGDKLTEIPPFEEKIEIFQLVKEDLTIYREKFPVNLDADSYRILP